MPFAVNLRHLERHDLVFKGEMPVSELDLDPRDAMIRVNAPLEYDLEVQKLDDSLLVRGQLRLTLDCQCVRCLKPFEFQLELGHWMCHLPLEGEERVQVINDCVDLTPHIREDILLEFPRHPLCKPGCRGLLKKTSDETKTSGAGRTDSGSSAWAELDKLKF